jgi:ABC-2 type transport system permease protein
MTTVPMLSQNPQERLRWFFADTWTIAKSSLIHWTKNPALIAYQLLWPIMSVLLFGYVFGSAMTVAGGGDYREFLMPGMFAQTVMFGVAATVGVVALDAQRGVTDRFRSMPMSQSAVLGGRSLADMVNSLLELTILILCGLAVGWAWNGTIWEALGAVGLLLLLRFGLIWVGIFLGLYVTPEAAAAAWAPLFPLTILANTFVSPDQMPGWLGAIAEWNPLSATVTATRQLFGNPGFGGGGWPTENALLLAILWPLLLVAIFFPLAVWRYRRLSR